jgi:hypothetical protein
MKTVYIYAKLANNGTHLQISASLFNNSPKGYYPVAVINSLSIEKALLSSLPSNFCPPQSTQSVSKAALNPAIQSSFS